MVNLIVTSINFNKILYFTKVIFNLHKLVIRNWFLNIYELYGVAAPLELKNIGGVKEKRKVNLKERAGNFLSHKAKKGVYKFLGKGLYLYAFYKAKIYLASVYKLKRKIRKLRNAKLRKKKLRYLLNNKQINLMNFLWQYMLLICKLGNTVEDFSNLNVKNFFLIQVYWFKKFRITRVSALFSQADLGFSKFFSKRLYKFFRIESANKIKIQNKRRLKKVANAPLNYMLHSTIYRLYFKQSKNNMFLTLLSKRGYVINTKSVGMLGFLGPKRPTSFAAEQLGRSFGNYLAEKRVKTFFVVFRTKMSKNIKAAVFGLFSISTDNIVGFVDLVIRAHNGVLSKVRRRI